MNVTACSVIRFVKNRWSGSSSTTFSPSYRGNGGSPRIVGCSGPLSFEYGVPKKSSKPRRSGMNSGWHPRCHLP